MSQLWRWSSCWYFARKRIALSTAIPKAMLNTNTVDGFQPDIEIPHDARRDNERDEVRNQGKK
jgi:hypothetical protein